MCSIAAMQANKKGSPWLPNDVLAWELWFILAQMGMRVYGILTLVMALLQQKRRVSSWALKQEFGLADAFIEGLKQELIVAKRVAIDEGGQVLVWTGEGLPPATQAVVQSTPIAAAATLPLPSQALPPHATP